MIVSTDFIFLGLMLFLGTVTFIFWVWHAYRVHRSFNRIQGWQHEITTRVARLEDLTK